MKKTTLAYYLMILAGAGLGALVALPRDDSQKKPKQEIRSGCFDNDEFANKLREQYKKGEISLRQGDFDNDGDTDFYVTSKIDGTETYYERINPKR